MMNNWWKTISVLKMDGEVYVYQQRYRMNTEARRHGGGFAGAAYPTHKHRLIPMKETLDENAVVEMLS